jgi:hypothetical protein
MPNKNSLTHATWLFLAGAFYVVAMTVANMIFLLYWLLPIDTKDKEHLRPDAEGAFVYLLQTFLVLGFFGATVMSFGLGLFYVIQELPIWIVVAGGVSWIVGCSCLIGLTWLARQGLWDAQEAVNKSDLQTVVYFSSGVLAVWSAPFALTSLSPVFVSATLMGAVGLIVALKAFWPLGYHRGFNL